MLKSNGSDVSHGYESIATKFIAARGTSSQVGVATVREWARQFPPSSSVLDLGCGNGVPVTKTLLACGLVTYGVDAAPSMVAAFRERFPQVAVECDSVERSRFFDRTFDGAIAWGLIFLLPPENQAAVIRKVSTALKKGGRFLFTSPRQPCEWLDAMTGQRSVSLGAEQYARLLASAEFSLVGECRDEGENDYYLARKS